MNPSPLQAVDTRGVAPLLSAGARAAAPLRPDTPVPALPLEDVLANAPRRVGSYFVAVKGRAFAAMDE